MCAQESCLLSRAGFMVAGVEPNAENKLFVGGTLREPSLGEENSRDPLSTRDAHATPDAGCPPGSGEEDLRALFEKHGRVEEVFVMRGGSRSGMACAFVRFAEQPVRPRARTQCIPRI